MKTQSSVWSGPERRRIGRTTNERRDWRTRLEGIWTEAERERFIQAVREQRHDAQAVTVRAPAPESPSPSPA
jgi:hypothetical protein